MKKTQTVFVVVLLLSFMVANFSFAEGFPGIPEKKKDKLMADFRSAKKEFAITAGFPIGLSIDIKLGYGTTSASVTPTGNNLYNTGSKGGFQAGATLTLSLLDMLSFSTGLDFLAKNFSVTPTTPTVPNLNQSPTDIANNFLNIPLNIDLTLLHTEIVGLDFKGGPYIGLNLSADSKNTGLGMKTFDLGLNGTLTGSYKIAPLTYVILGTKVEYGGLNNLGATETVDKVTTTNFSVFSGIRFAF